MAGIGAALAVLWGMALWHAAAAGDLAVRVTDADGRPLADAVVTLGRPGMTPASGTAPDTRHVIDQTDETFVPYVEIVPLGGQLVFTNSDRTRHHVYSFSPTKTFQFVLAPGEASQPVVFDRPGVVAVGCNIHDQMVAYVYVADRPWAGRTDKDGRAVLTGLSDGDYELVAWHPRLRPGRQPASREVAVGATAAGPVVALDVLPEPRTRPGHEHPRY